MLLGIMASSHHRRAWSGQAYLQESVEVLGHLLLVVRVVRIVTVREAHACTTTTNRRQ